MSEEKNVKRPMQSKTIWLNMLSLAIALLTAAVGHEYVLQHPRAAALLTAALSAANVLLRLVTSQPVSPLLPGVLSKEDPPDGV